jgi:amidohydrolase
MIALSKEFLKRLVEFRQEIHQYPEVSNQEVETANRIIQFASEFNPDEIISGVGGNGLLVLFKGENEGKCTAIRAELDALPIHEAEGNVPHQSIHKGTAHLCGHDGHMVMVLSLLEYLSINRPVYGSVMLLFQPAEETGEGAEQLLKDEQFLNNLPDEIIGLHNIPGEPLGKLLISHSHFAAASKGLKLFFKGSTAHAAEPEKGKNPAFAIARLINYIDQLESSNKQNEYAIATIVHLKVGEVAFGVSPADGVIMLTIRSFTDGALNQLTDQLLQKAHDLAKEFALTFYHEETEAFPATINHEAQANHLIGVTDKLDYSYQLIDLPFKWSEDFGHYLKKVNGVFFGLGSGEDQPVLHHESFDFPDELIPYGFSIYQSYLQKNHY